MKNHLLRLKRNFFISTSLLLLFLFFGFCFSDLIAKNETADADFLLAKSYAPNFVFAKGENYFPCDYRKYYFADNQEVSGEQALKNYQSLTENEKLNNFEIFYQVERWPENEISIQYWQFYVFNDFFNEHFGDAESLTIFIDSKTQRIKRAIGSAHLGSQMKVLAANNEIEGVLPDHLNVLIEKGSHANYPDKNSNNLADPLELRNWDTAWGLYDWDNSKIGQTISHQNDFYKLRPLSEIFKDQDYSLNKSPRLGWPIEIKFDLLVYKADYKFYLPLGDSSLNTNYVASISQNPTAVLPFHLSRLSNILNPTKPQPAPKLAQETLPEESPIPDQKPKFTQDLPIIAYQPRLSDQEMAKRLEEFFKSQQKGQVAGTSTQAAISSKPKILVSQICAGIYGAQNEFIELFNDSENRLDLIDNPIDIYIADTNGNLSKKNISWQQRYIEPKSYYLLAPGMISIAMDQVQPDGLYSAGVSHTGCVVIKDKDKNTLDTLSWGKKIHCPEEQGIEIYYGLKTNYCLKRKKPNNLPIDTNNNPNDFLLLEESCPHNSFGQNLCEQFFNQGGSSPTTKKDEPIILTAPCLLRINEIMYNPSSSDAGYEWIEIFNQSENSCELRDFTLTEGSVNHRIESVSGSAHIIDGLSYALLSPSPQLLQAYLFPTSTNPNIAKCAISLNNDGEEIFIKYKNLTTGFYKYTSSSGANGNTDTLQYFVEGWEESAPTPNHENIRRISTSTPTTTQDIPTTTPTTTINTTSTIDWSLVRINEVMFNHPTGHFTKKWLEIFNGNTESVSTTDCKIEEADGETSHKRQIIDIGQGADVPANGFLIISADDSISQEKFISFNDNFIGQLARANFDSFGKTGSWLKLLCLDQEISFVDFSSNTDAQGNGNSWQYFPDAWWGSPPTPGQENVKIQTTTTDPANTSTPTSTTETPTSSNPTSTTSTGPGWDEETEPTGPDVPGF